MLKDKVIRTTFLVSFIGHCLFLGMPGFNLNSFLTKNPEEITVRIQIERPPLLPKIDVMGQEKKLGPEEIVIEGPLEEESIEAMLRYQDMVKQRIEEARRYPIFAKRQGIEGTVHLSFIVLSNGISRDIKIIHSSASKILDEEAVATIKRVNLFPPFPKEIKTSFIQIEVSIVFTLQ